MSVYIGGQVVFVCVFQDKEQDKDFPLQHNNTFITIVSSFWVIYCEWSIFLYNITMIGERIVSAIHYADISKQLLKGLIVYVGVCCKCFLCLYTWSYCKNELCKQTCNKDKHKQPNRTKPKTHPSKKVVNNYDTKRKTICKTP